MALCKFMVFFLHLDVSSHMTSLTWDKLILYIFVVFFLSETNESLEADIWDVPLIVLNNFYDSCVLKEI
jgi:hypothetical protein